MYLAHVCVFVDDVHCRAGLLHTSSILQHPQVAGQSWFGGGCDLTPSYLYEQDAQEFHTFWKQLCDRYDPDIYPSQKAWCDK